MNGEDRSPEIEPELLADPVFQRVLADGLAIQDRFSAEPVYGATGTGLLRSAGVEEIRAAKESLRAAVVEEEE